ncbi:hypothetical protein [Ileibacterium valens]|uniref:hypothetical protein n=1 Tax=Ileibacterium valens TaxID=1862668 RepID=UPI002729ABB5|nr:hypothetical protein [Ileibacterium valens]
MEKMKMESRDLFDSNIRKISDLFPEVITEAYDSEGRIKKTIDFKILKELLSGSIVEGGETYSFTWPGKKSALAAAHTPIRKTLRPSLEQSMDWEKAKNLYIEGDNLDVLKLLQECYLNRIKMIYIDPPYNTGHDFIYMDSFESSKARFEEKPRNQR